MTQAPLDTEREAQLTNLLRDVSSWDGRLETAGPLRERARSIGEIQRKPGSPAEGLLLKVLSAYGKKTPGKLLADPDGEPEAGRTFGCFLGDPQMGKWPWLDPLTIADDAAVRWLPLLAVQGPADDPAILAFVTMMFHMRRRVVWVPASQALARLATRDATARETLVRLWHQTYPEGLPKKWPAGGLLPPPEGKHQVEDNAADAIRHRARHVLHAVSAYAALDGDLTELVGASPAHLAGMSLPKDGADASAVLLALRALAGGAATKAIALAALPARAADASGDEMCEAVLRQIADDLRARKDPADATALDAVCRRLAEPRWKGCRRAKRLDALWSWLLTARWSKDHGDEPVVAAMQAAADEAGPALRLALDGTPPDGADAVTAIVPRLRDVLLPEFFDTTAEAERTTRLAELLLLLETPAVKELPWRSLVLRAAGPGPAAAARDGTVAQSARADLALILADRAIGLAVLLRDVSLQREDARTLAGSESKFISTQVALQLERLLREEVVAPEEQVRFLWQVLQRRPPTNTFRELLTMLRGSGQPLHKVVAAVAKLDRLRAAKAPIPDIAIAYRELAEYALALLPSTPAPPSDAESVVALRRRIQHMASALERAGAAASGSIGDEAWCAAVRDLVLGTPREDDGIEGWMDWLGTPVKGLLDRWNRVESAAGALRGAGDAVTRAQGEELLASVLDLRRSLGTLAWPEADVVEDVLASAEWWAKERLAAARRGEWERDRFRQLIDRADEPALAALTEEKEAHRLAFLGAADLRRLGRFLLDHLLLVRAQRLRALVRQRVQLPAVWSYLAPLLFGVAGGTFLVLDAGTGWNDVLVPERGHPLAFGAVVAVGLVCSFLFLAGNLAGRMAATVGGGGWRKVGAVCRRVLPVYLGALVLAFAVTALAMWTLEGTEMRIASDEVTPLPYWSQLTLWSSLTLFLGVFVGLVLQGRGVTTAE